MRKTVFIFQSATQLATVNAFIFTMASNTGMKDIRIEKELKLCGWIWIREKAVGKFLLDFYEKRG